MFNRIAESVYFEISRSFDSNITYIDCGDRQILVDTGTGLFADSLNGSLEKLGTSLDRITDVILTHSHIDHLGGIFRLLKNDGLQIYLHRLEGERINSGDMELTLARDFGSDIPSFKVGQLLRDGQILKFGDVELLVLHSPGHSEGSICLHERNMGIMITGDTMFTGGSFGRVDLPSGDPEALVRSLKRLSELDFSVALPGHMSPVTSGAKRSAQLSYEFAREMFMT